MGNFISKLASVEEVEGYYNEKIKNEPEDESLKTYKLHFIQGVRKGTRLCYFGFLNGRVVCKGAAKIAYEENCEKEADLIDKTTAYLFAFETNPKFEGKCYFSKLYHFIEQDLRERGFRKLTVGVEPCEIRNIQIYFHLGFTKYVKTDFETFEPETKGEKGKTVVVCYYAKEI